MAAITWSQTPTTKKITLPTGNSYWVKDDEVRQWIGDGSTSGAEKRLSDAETAIAALSNATHWVGITTTVLTDGATTNPITINGSSYTAVTGDIAAYQPSGQPEEEFIFNGTAWQKFGGSIGTLGAMAYVDTGTATYTPSGNNDSSAVSFSGGTDDSVLGADTTISAADSAVSFSGQTGGNLVKTTVPNVTNAGTAASWSATVENEVLTFAWTANTVPTLGTPIDVATGAVDANGTGDTVVTAVGTGTAAGQTITVGTDDLVTAVTSIGTGTAAGQTFHGTQATITVNPTQSQGT